jgi:hypothetical protein
VTLDKNRILDLINRHDDIGVLSLYLGITPDRAAEPKPGWPIAISNELRALKERVREDRSHDHAVAIIERIDSLGREIERFVDASRHGRGRALFASMSDDRVETLSLQIPFRDRVVLDRNPYVRPLVAALDEGRPAGLVSVHKNGLRVLEWSLGEAEEIAHSEFGVRSLDWRQKSGPAPAQPLDSREGGQRRDEFEERMDENRLRFVRDQARSVADEANRRAWDRLVVAGDPRLTKAFADELHPAGGEQLHITDLSWQDEAPNVVAGQAWDLFKVLRRERAERLITLVQDRTLSGNAGALGPGDVCACLNEGRVDQLLVAADAHVTGYRSRDGLLYTDEQRPAAASAELVEEPYLVERMIERALETDATITPIDEDVATPLKEYGGVGALLRW